MARPLTITFSSGVWLDADALLGTLAVFYDEIALPYPYGHVRGGEQIWIGGPDRAELDIQAAYDEWRERNRLLFEAGILKTLPPPLTRTTIPTDFATALDRVMAAGEIDPVAFYRGDFALAVHAVYARKPSPEVFVAGSKVPTIDQVTAALVTSLLQYQIPVLGDLRVDQILEVRERLRDVKEGFADYLATQTDDVEQRLKGGDLDLLNAAGQTVDRKLGPWYHEMKRQVGDKKTGFWAKIAELSGKFLQIDAAPWTPKFYGGVLEMFGAKLGEASKFDAESRSNASVAFQYISRLEDETNRRLTARS